jgi:pyridoxamine 5'-phosphate oxidase
MTEGVRAADMRVSYCADGLELTDLDPDPCRQFERWLSEAVAADLPEPNAMILATASADGWPNARVVLLKGCEPGPGFVFFTNLRSVKGRELAGNPRAALVLPWHAMSRQVRIRGTVQPVDRAEVVAYFQERPRGSQIGAWASEQSSVIPSREVLERRYQEVETQFAGAAVPPPDHWGGLRVRPETIEFWQGRENRLHDRFRYCDAAGGWRIERLSP